MEQLASKNISVDSITKVLDLTHLLEGSVLRIADRIRINVKLFSTADNTQLWYKNFDRDMSSLSIYEILDEQKKKGVAILFIGEDLDVLLELCDKIMVIHNGEIMDVVDPLKVTKEDLGLLMMGQKLGKESSDD